MSSEVLFCSLKHYMICHMNEISPGGNLMNFLNDSLQATLPGAIGKLHISCRWARITKECISIPTYGKVLWLPVFGPQIYGHTGFPSNKWIMYTKVAF